MQLKPSCNLLVILNLFHNVRVNNLLLEEKVKARNACGYAVQSVYLTVLYLQYGSRVKYTKLHASYFSVSTR